MRSSFPLPLDTKQQLEFMRILLNTVFDIVANKKDRFVRLKLPIGWQDVVSSTEKTESITNLADSLLDRIAEYETKCESSKESCDKTTTTRNGEQKRSVDSEISSEAAIS